MPSRRNYTSSPVTLSFPPFTRAVSWLLGINLAVYLLLELLNLAPATAPLASAFLRFAALFPLSVAHGWLWQLVTYAFVHGQFLALLINMLMLWMFGAQLEQTWGARRFLQLYFFSLVGAALVTTGVAFTGGLGLDPSFPTVGASGGIYGLLIAFGMIFGEMEIMMFPFPFLMKAKYMIWILIVVTLAGSLRQGGLGNLAQMGGLVFGFVFVKFIHERRPARARSPGVLPGRGLSDRQFDAKPKPSLLAGWRDSYYRWKRRRAAKKFEVYMRKHDRKVFFDEHGNYIDPESAEGRKREQDEGKSPWVN